MPRMRLNRDEPGPPTQPELSSFCKNVRRPGQWEQHPKPKYDQKCLPKEKQDNWQDQIQEVGAEDEGSWDHSEQ